MSSLAKTSSEDGKDDEGFGLVNWIAMIFGGIMVIVVIAFITYYANKELQNEIEAAK